MLKVGDQIKGMMIQEIGSNFVLLAGKENETVKMNLYKGAKVRPAPAPVETRPEPAAGANEPHAAPGCAGGGKNPGCSVPARSGKRAARSASRRLKRKNGTEYKR